MIGGLFCDFPHSRRGLVPLGKIRVGQQSCGERRGVHDSHSSLLEHRHDVGQHRVLERVVIVGEDHVQVSALQDILENLHRIAADADEANFSLLLLFSQGGQSRRAGKVSLTICDISTNSMSWQSIMSR